MFHKLSDHLLEEDNTEIVLTTDQLVNSLLSFTYKRQTTDLLVVFLGINVW